MYINADFFFYFTEGGHKNGKTEGADCLVNTDTGDAPGIPSLGTFIHNLQAEHGRVQGY